MSAIFGFTFLPGRVTGRSHSIYIYIYIWSSLGRASRSRREVAQAGRGFNSHAAESLEVTFFATSSQNVYLSHSRIDYTFTLTFIVGPMYISPDFDL